MYKMILSSLLAVTIFASFAHAATTEQQGPIVIQESYAQPATTRKVEIKSIPGASNTYYSGEEVAGYQSTLKMREERKVGAGLTVGGALGFAGVNIEFNFEEADGVLAGFGTGPGYNSVQLAWKHAFEGDFLAPYTTVGYSRWYNSRGRTDDYRNSDILDRVLTENEKIDGRFGTNFVNASLGLQYNQLDGDLQGLSFFGELTAMYELNSAKLLPNGAVGALYYF